MSKCKRNFLISFVLVLISIVYTILVKTIDVQMLDNGSNIGFYSLNKFIFDGIGVNMIWYHITEIIGYVALLIAAIYGIIGVIQFIERKSLFKVDKEIILLGIFYVAVIAMYVLFEKVIINYRPILMDGVLEASYPSSHTLMTLCICISSIFVNRQLFDNKMTKVLNVISIIMAILMVIGRLISGVHWFTDIIGGIIISSALLMIFYSSLKFIKKSN